MKKGAWIVGGTTLIGTGVGFIFLETSALLFLVSIVVGIGSGLVIAALLGKADNNS